MMNLNDREWGSFTFESMFNIYRGESVYKQYMNKGNIPYVSATALNNGISDYIDQYNREWNSISLAYDGSIGSTFFQSTKWFASEKIVSINLKNRKLNRHIALFLCQAISRQKYKYNYGHKWSVGIRMMRGRLLLPIDEKGNPDFVFMEEYIKERERMKILEYVDFCKEKLALLGIHKSVFDIDNIKWKSFYIQRIFDKPQRGKRIIKENHKEGSIPLVSSYGQRNGVTHFVGNDDSVRKFANCISVANGGSSAGRAFYQPYTFIASDHVTQCWNTDLNQYQYLFLATVITKAFAGKYSFSHEISDPRLAKEKIMLPALPSGEPNYDYMEQYGKKMIAQKYQEYLDYID